MKKLSLLLASAMLVSVSALAQPTKPTVTKFLSFDDVVYNAEKAYLYNVEAGLFMTNGNEWGTHASIVTNDALANSPALAGTYEELLAGKASASGLLWEIVEGNLYEVGDTKVLCYTFHQDAAKAERGEMKDLPGYLYIDGWNDAEKNSEIVYVDGPESKVFRDKWYINKLDGNTFQIGFLYNEGTTEEPIYSKANGLLGAQKFADGDTRVLLIEGANTTWALVSEDEYKSILPKLNLYYVQVGLADLISKAKEQGLSIDAEYEKLVNDANAKRDDVIAAIDIIAPTILLNEAIKEAKAVDAARSYEKFEKIAADPEVTAEELNEATTLLKALTALKKSINALEGRDNAAFLAVYNSDESTLKEVNDTKALADTFLSLKEAIDKAKAEYPSLDFSAPAAVYSNPDATAEDIAAAKDKVQSIIDDHLAGQATVDNPKDYSHYITNATFDKVGDFTGWSGTAFGAGGTTSTCAEHYSKNFDTYQDLNGGKDIPNGVYRVGVNAFYRAGKTAEDWATKDDPTVRHAQLYAASDALTITTALPALATWATSENLGNQVVQQDGYYLPNSMKDFTTYEDAGLAKEVYVYAVVTNNKLRIGVKKSTTITDDWTIVDNFSLLYLGQGADAYALVSEDVLAEAERKLSAIEWENVYYTKSLKEAYDKAKAQLETAADASSIESVVVLADSLVGNVAAWQAYDDAVAKAMESDVLIDGTGEYVDRLEEYVNGKSAPSEEFPNGTYKYIIEQLSLSTAEVLAETDSLNSLLDLAIKTSMKPGQDVSSMLKNPKFAEGFTGWTNNTTGSNKGTAGGLKAYPCVETYDATIDVYQIVENVPDGIYSLSCRAFERPKGNENEKTPTGTYLYMNDFKTPVQNIIADGLPKDDAINYVNSFFEGSVNEDYTNTGGTTNNDVIVTNSDGDELYVPNGMSGASYAFRAGRYEQKVYGIIEGGTMKIGLTSNGKQVEWTLWADFILTYEGKTEESISNLIDNLCDRADEYMGENEDYITNPAYDALDKAIVAASDAQDEGDVDAMWNALLALNKALDAAQENVAAVTALKAAIDELENASNEAENPSSAALDAYDEVEPKTAEDAIMNLTTEEVKALTEEVKKVAALLRINGDYENATDENPTDMTSSIVNPDFEIGNASGWTYAFAVIGNIGYQSNKVYENGDVSLNQFIEGWRSGNAPIGDGTIEQTIAVLPAGTYVLGADIIANLQSGKAEDTKGFFLFASEAGGNKSAIEVATDNEKPQHFEVTFTKASDDSAVTIGLEASNATGNWLAADNFTLTYYGKNSALEADGDATPIEGVTSESTAAISAIYTITGAKVSSLQKGINIVKYADGKVAKVLVK